MHINSAIINVQSRPAQFMGRDHVVVPVVMVVEGVHAGSAGPMFYPSEEIKATAEQWDGVPVTVQHPTDKDDNLTVAANAPEFIIGHISKSVWDDKLRAEAWIDVEKANNISGDIMTIIHGDGQLQVSTGLFSSDEIVKGDWKGESYNAIVKDIVPDHLALLPGGEGACNWADGCGIRANKEGGENCMKFKGFDMTKILESLEPIPPKVLKAFVVEQAIDDFSFEGKIKTNETSHSDIRGQIQNQINDKDTQIQWNFVRDVFDKFFVYSKEQDGQPTQMFKQGYSLNASEAVEFAGDEVEVVQKTEYILKNNKKFNRKENKMADEKKCCPEKVKALIDNEKSNYTDKDMEWLEGMEEDQLDKMIANVGISEDAEKSLVTLAVEKAFNEAIRNGEMVKVEKKDPDAKDKPPTAEEYIANAPGEIQDVLRASLNMHKEKKTALVQRIIANAQNRFTQEQLEPKEVGELENIAALIPLKVVDENGQQVSYAANSGNVNDNTNKEEPLEMPTIEVQK